MRRIHSWSRPLFLGFGTVLLATAGFASGFSIVEQGSKATAMGGAFAATADDPSAIFYNVSGIAYQRKTAVLAGGTSINFGNEFISDPASDYPGGGVTESYRNHTFVPPNGYVIVPIGENLTFGVGTFSAFGLRTDWKNPATFSGRFISQDANLKTFSVEPAIAWKTSDGRFALGLGAEYRRSEVQLSQNLALPGVNPFTLQVTDIAHAQLSSDWDNAWGYNVGLMFRPNDRWSIGAAYRSDMTIKYKGQANFTQISTGNAQLDQIVAGMIPPDQNVSTAIDFPATTSLGVATTLIPNWRVEFDATYTTWSRFQSLDVNFDTTPSANITRVEDWHNTWSYRIGADRPVTSNVDVRLGAVYDRNPQPTEGVGPLLPDADRTGVSFGLGWHGAHWSLDATEFALVFARRGTNGENVDNFNGTYKTTANLVSVDLGYHF